MQRKISRLFVETKYESRHRIGTKKSVKLMHPKTKAKALMEKSERSICMTELLIGSHPNRIIQMIQHVKFHSKIGQLFIQNIGILRFMLPF